MPNDAPDWTRATTGIQEVRATLTAAANSSVVSSISVPAGTQAIGYEVRSDAGADTPLLVTFHGNSTANDYFAVVPGSNIGGVQWSPFGAGDASVTVTVQARVLSPARIDVLVSPMALAVNVVQRFADVWNVQLLSNAGLSPNINSQGGGNATLAVDMQLAQPASWQAASADYAVGTGTIAAGATLVLQAGTALRQMRLWEQSFHLTAGAAGSFGQLQDTGGTALRQMNFAVADTYQFQFNGRALAVGLGLQIKNTSAAATGAINGGGSYSLT